jgi:hypothetical protein
MVYYVITHGDLFILNGLLCHNTRGPLYSQSYLSILFVLITLVCDDNIRLACVLENVLLQVLILVIYTL